MDTRRLGFGDYPIVRAHQADSVRKMPLWRPVSVAGQDAKGHLPGVQRRALATAAAFFLLAADHQVRRLQSPFSPAQARSRDEVPFLQARPLLHEDTARSAGNDRHP